MVERRRWSCSRSSSLFSIFDFRFTYSYFFILFIARSWVYVPYLFETEDARSLLCDTAPALAHSAQRRAAGHVHCPCPPLVRRGHPPVHPPLQTVSHTQMFCLGYTQPRVHRPSRERWLLIRPPLPFFLHLPTLKRLTPTAEALHGVLLCSRMPFLRARHALWFGLLLVARQSSRH